MIIKNLINFAENGRRNSNFLQQHQNLRKDSRRFWKHFLTNENTSERLNVPKKQSQRHGSDPVPSSLPFWPRLLYPTFWRVLVSIRSGADERLQINLSFYCWWTCKKINYSRDRARWRKSCFEYHFDKVYNWKCIWYQNVAMPEVNQWCCCQV